MATRRGWGAAALPFPAGQARWAAGLEGVFLPREVGYGQAERVGL